MTITALYPSIFEIVEPSTTFSTPVSEAIREQRNKANDMGKKVVAVYLGYNQFQSLRKESKFIEMSSFSVATSDDSIARFEGIKLFTVLEGDHFTVAVK